MSVQQLRRPRTPHLLREVAVLLARCVTAVSCISGWIIVVVVVFGVILTAFAASTGLAALLLATLPR